MSLQKHVYTSGQWYSYFYVPPKSPNMLIYYMKAEAEFSRLYSFLPKDQIHGKLLDFLGVPNTYGKINKSKLRQIFLFETSTKGKKKLSKQENRVQEVRIAPPQSLKPYSGPFKFFKSKNSRKLSEESDRPLQNTSISDDDSCAYVSPVAKIEPNAITSKKEAKKLTEPYKSFFKLSKAKNPSKQLLESDVEPIEASRINSVKRPPLTDRIVASHMEVTSSDGDNDVQHIAHNSKTKAKSAVKTKRGLERSRRQSDGQIQTTIIRHRPRTTSPLWYENIVSSESSKSYNAESDEASAKPNISSKNKNKCSILDQNTETTRAGKSNDNKYAHNPETPLSAKTTAKPKILSILCSEDSEDDDDLIISKKLVKLSKPASGKSDENLNQISVTLGTKRTFHDEPHGKNQVGELKNVHTVMTTEEPVPLAVSPKLDERLPKDATDNDEINANRKTVEFKNVDDYYYYYKDSSSLTQKSSSTHWSAELKSDFWKNDSSSDDNDYDTGFVSPMVMSQESQLMSQTKNTSGNARPSNAKLVPRVCEIVPPKFPPVAQLTPSCELEGFVEESPGISSSVDQNESLALQNVPEVRYSPVSSQGLPSAAHPITSSLGMFSPDLELVRRIGSLRPGDEENLSQISAATEIFSARVMVDLRNPGAYEAIQQHCRSIFEAVNSQNVFAAIPRGISFGEQEPVLTPPNRNVSEEITSPQTLCMDSQSLQEKDQQRMPPVLVESGAEFCPRPQDIVASPTADQKSSKLGASTGRDEVPPQTEDSEPDNCKISESNDNSQTLASSMVSQTNDDTLKTPERRKKLPFKKRLPILSAPKLKIVTFNQPVPPTVDTSPKVVTHRSPSGSIKTSTTGSSISNVRQSSIACIRTKEPTKQDAAAGKKRSSVARVDIVKPSSAGVETSATKNLDSCANFKNSSIASVESRPSMARVVAANSLAGSVKMSSLGSFVGPTSLKSSSAANIKSSNKSDTENVKNSSAASYKTASSAAATNKSLPTSSSAKAGYHFPQQHISRAADKSNVGSHPGWRKDGAAESRSDRGKVGAGSHSSKGSLKEWQRQANLAWKMSLPHISQQFFNDPNAVETRMLGDDVLSRSGVTWSEPSSRVKVREVKTRPNPPASGNPERRLDPGDGIYLEETHDRDTTEMSGSPPKTYLGGLSPFLRDFLFNDSGNPERSVYPNDVDPDAETQKRSQQGINMDAPSLEKNYSRDSSSDMSLASRSTADRASDREDSCRPPAVAGHPDRPLPAWWQREYSTPKGSLQEESDSDDSMVVILPRSQLQRDAANADSHPADIDDVYLPDVLTRKDNPAVRSNFVGRSSAVQTRLMRKPPSSENQAAEHDFFITLAQLAAFRPVTENEENSDQRN